MSLSTQPYKGARDFYPAEKRLQNYMFSTMQHVVELYGYEAYDAPILEPTELYLAKGSQEIIQEQTYTFQDRGGRSVTIRTEMTPSVSRMVAGQRQELAYPLRWYSIPNMWRYERMQRGRLREFWQLNVDIFGVDNMTAEVEMIQISNDILKAFGAQAHMFDIRINSRALVRHLFEKVLELNEVQSSSLIRLIDKMHKMEQAQFVAHVDAIFTPEQREHHKPAQLLKFLTTTDVRNLPPEIKGHESGLRLLEIFETLKQLKITNAVFDPTIMRGFDYYTDVVFEVFDTNAENNRSMFGGGRYDGLVGQFGVEPVPTVGFGMGDVTLQNFLEAHNLIPQLPTTTDVRIILIGGVYQKVFPLIKKLRDEGVNVSVDSTDRKLDKQIKSAAKAGLQYVVILGGQEIESGRYTVKNLLTGTDEEHGVDRLISILKDRRSVSDDLDLS